jgi:hypothetical protein
VQRRRFRSPIYGGTTHSHELIDSRHGLQYPLPLFDPWPNDTPGGAHEALNGARMEDDSSEPSHAAKPNWTTFSGSGRMTAEIQILPKKTLVGKRFLQDLRFS